MVYLIATFLPSDHHVYILCFSFPLTLTLKHIDNPSLNFLICSISCSLCSIDCHLYGVRPLSGQSLPEASLEPGFEWRSCPRKYGEGLWFLNVALYF
jgi:hypothetical protein